MQFLNSEINSSDKYPIQWVDIGTLHHKRIKKELLGKKKENPPQNITEVIAVNKMSQQWYHWMEKVLIHLDKDRSFSEDEPYHPEGRKKAEETKDSMLSIFRDFRDNEVMWNPIIAFLETDGELYILMGSQRVCSLRALNYKEQVPVRVMISDVDNLSTMLNPAILYHPYNDQTLSWLQKQYLHELKTTT